MMAIFGKSKKINPNSLKVDESLCGPHDPICAYLLDQVSCGAIPIYHAVIPFSRIKPFDSEHSELKHPAGKKVAQQVFEQLKAGAKSGKYKEMLVYPHLANYIMSDDYFTYFAYRKLKIEKLPCWVLGLPDNSVEDIRGPVPREQIKSVLGLE